MITGNKGEWSEIYTFFKLLADGRLYAADAHLNKIEDIYYPIIKILRTESDEKWQYIRNGRIKLVNGNDGQVLLTIPIKEFAQNAHILLAKIRNGKSAFAVPEVEDFMKKINCTTLKAPSEDKTDITLVVHDLKVGFQPTFGFSIKSRLGHASTLLNPSRATNFIYKTNSLLDDETIDRINSISKGAKIRKRIEEIEENSSQLQYYDVENEVFKLNLQVIDSKLPLILSKIILNFYRGNATDLETLTKLVESENPCNYVMNYNHSFYTYKIKTFLTDVALGMTPTTVWNGLYDASGGYIVVREDGEVLCYHIYNRNEFQDYLLKNTKLDTPSSTRYKFGKLYKDREQLFIKLNLQVRFKV